MPPPLPCRFNSLTSPSDPHFDDLCAIYSKAIPTREQKPKAELSAMVSRPDYRFLLAQEGSIMVGFSISFVPAIEPFCLLEYMAIHEQHRNRGLGRQLFQETVKTVQKEFTVMEVDSDREPSADHDTRKCRLSFYRTLGCRRIEGCKYILPLPGKDPPPEMDLLIYAPNTTATIPQVTLRKWLEVIYADVYRCAKDDSRIAKMLQGVRDRVELG